MEKSHPTIPRFRKRIVRSQDTRDWTGVRLDVQGGHSLGLTRLLGLSSSLLVLLEVGLLQSPARREEPPEDWQ